MPQTDSLDLASMLSKSARSPTVSVEDVRQWLLAAKIRVIDDGAAAELANAITRVKRTMDHSTALQGGPTSKKIGRALWYLHGILPGWVEQRRQGLRSLPKSRRRTDLNNRLASVFQVFVDIDNVLSAGMFAEYQPYRGREWHDWALYLGPSVHKATGLNRTGFDRGTKANEVMGKALTCLGFIRTPDAISKAMRKYRRKSR